MVINHNMSSLYADRVLGMSNDSIMKNMEKLSIPEVFLDVLDMSVSEGHV